jgi:hypothetical protein
LPTRDPAYPLTCSNPSEGLAVFNFLNPKKLNLESLKSTSHLIDSVLAYEFMLK